jgi:hypothetical protein
MIPPRHCDTIFQKIEDAADFAISNGWSFSQYMQAVKQAWLSAHENNLRQAKYQVEQEGK